MRLPLWLNVLFVSGLLAACQTTRPPAADQLAYSLRQPAQVSMNLYDAQGHVVRELLHAAPRPVGRSVETWDGCDEDGKPLPPGEYTWKLLATPGLKAEYLLSLGANYPNGANDWRHRAPGSHGGPTAVTSDPTGIYVAASCTENIENYLLKMDPAATNRLWSAFQHVPWNGGVALASANGTLFVLGNNHDIWTYDAATGKLAATFQPVVNGEKPVDLAARGDQLAICYSSNNIVQWLDQKTGAVLDTATVPAASAVAVSSNGTVFVISSNAVVSVSRSAQQPVPVLTGLVAPQRLDVEEATGDLLVAEGGVSQQVKRFGLSVVRGSPDPAQEADRQVSRGESGDPAGAGSATVRGRETGAQQGYRLLATYGRAGGRQDGLYHPEDFREVRDLTSDGAGGFFVAEPNTAPRRVAHFDKAGQLLAEWYGGQTWAPWMAVEPDNPNAVWMNSSWTDMMRLTVDYRARTWKVHSTYRYAGLADGLIPGHANAVVWEAFLRDGQLYLGRVGGWGPCLLRVDRAAWRLMPSTVCDAHIWHDMHNKPDIVAKDRGANKSYQWNDANRDGRVQPAEITFYPPEGPWFGRTTYDARGNFLFNGGQYTWTATNAAGAPVYGDFPKPAPLPATPPRVTKIEPRWGSYLQRDPATGDLYGAFNDRMPTWGQSEDSFLVKWEAESGKQKAEGGNYRIAWTVGRLGDGPGRIWRPFRRFVGFAHGCPVLTGFSYEYPQDGPTATYVWDPDGLWVGSVFDSIDLEAAPENLYSLGGEALAAQLVTESNGDVLFYGCWLNEVRVYCITGWNGWVRRSGKVTLSDATHGDRGTTAEGQSSAVRGSPDPAHPADRQVSRNRSGDPAGAGSAPVRGRETGAQHNTATGAGLLGAYYRSSVPQTNTLVVTRLDPVIDFTWGVWGTTNSTPLAEITTPYSVRWTGWLVPPRSGLYGFRSDAPTTVGKILIGGQMFQSPGSDRASRATYRVRLEAGRPYPIEIAYDTAMTHPTTQHGIKFQWLPPQGGWEPVPVDILYPVEPAAPKSLKK